MKSFLTEAFNYFWMPEMIVYSIFYNNATFIKIYTYLTIVALL